MRETFLAHLTHLAKLAQVRKQKQLAFTFYRAMKQLRLHDESDHIASIEDLSRVKGIGPFILKQLTTREKRRAADAEEKSSGEKRPRKPRSPRASATTVIANDTSANVVTVAAVADAAAAASGVKRPRKKPRSPRVVVANDSVNVVAPIVIVDVASPSVTPVVVAPAAARRQQSKSSTKTTLPTTFVASKRDASDPAELRRVAIEHCRRLAETRPAFVDTETTGFRSDSEIIEIAAIDFDGSVLVDSLVQPVREIDRRALEVHGITLDSLVRAPRWPVVWPQLRPLLAAQRSIGAYNAPFDRRLLRQTNSQYGIGEQDEPKSHAWFCVQQLMVRFVSQATKAGRMRQFSLAAALEHLQATSNETFEPADVPFAHRALADAHNTRKLFLHIVNQDLNKQR
jgi:DNA polymerase III epsilon subunit-like protein